jgi:uncharacterized membrane protein
METKPKIKLILSPLDHKLEWVGKIGLAIMWFLAAYAFFELPDTIPIHFNVSGKADSYGNKLTLLGLPVLATIIYLGLTQLNKYPHLFNYMTTITEDNAEKQYTIATRMLRLLKLAILVIFSLIILFTYLTTIGVADGLGGWFLPVTIALVVIPTIISIGQLFTSHKK